MTPTETLQAVQSWPLEDRLELVFQLWDQIVQEGWQPQPSEALKAELERRWAAYKEDPSRALTWEQVIETVRRPR
jgi:putative addiction module component (TIGR02574 family)